MKALSMDLRRRILAAYDQGRWTRKEVAQRYDVSLGMVQKLLRMRRHQGDITPAYHRCGRKTLFTAAHRQQLRQALKRQSDLTLAELRQELGLDCSLPAIHYVLINMGLSLKKRRSAPPNKAAVTSRKHGGGGAAAKKVGSPIA